MARAPRALVPGLDDGAAVGSALPLDRATRHHLGRVLRLRPGERVELLDGAGGLAVGRWTDAGAVELLEQPRRAPARVATVRLALAPPRPSRLDWLVEKAVELGVAEILLLQTRHAARAVEPKRVERLQRKADEALLQCRRLWRCRVHPSAALDAVLAAHAGALWMGEAPGDETATAGSAGGPVAPTRPADAPLLLAVGPEGGFDADELARLAEHGAEPVRCGSGVLRVETAALALAVLAGA